MRFLLCIPFVTLIACQPAAPDPRGVDRDETLLTVSATGRAESRPDEARLSLGVTTLAPSASDASRLNNQKMAKVTAAISKFGIAAADLQTQNLTLSRVDYGKDRGRYQANNTLVVRLKQMDKVSDAVLAATEAGANVLTGPTLRVSDAEGAAMSAYENAYKAARSRADAYAKAAGLKVNRILAIRDGGQLGEEPVAMDVQMEAVMANAPPAIAAPAPPPPPFSPGVNSSTVSVRVDFALSN